MISYYIETMRNIYEVTKNNNINKDQRSIIPNYNHGLALEGDISGNVQCT